MFFAPLILGMLAGVSLAADEVVITFDKVETGKPMASYKDRDVVFALAHKPTRSKAAGRVMFFPHLKTDRKAGALLVKGAFAEPGVDPVRVGRELRAELETTAAWLGLGELQISENGDLAAVLRSG